MAGFSCLESGAGGGGIPNFPKKYNVWALAEGAAEALGEGWGIGSYFALSKAAEIFLKEVLNRIFDRDDVACGGLVEPLQTGSHRGGFPRSRRAGDQDEPRRAGKPFLKKSNGKTQLFHGGNLGFDITEDGAADSELAMQVDAETESRTRDEAGIVVRCLRLGSTDGPEIIKKFLVGGFCFYSNKLVAQADKGGRPFAQEKVACPCLEAGLAK